MESEGISEEEAEERQRAARRRGKHPTGFAVMDPERVRAISEMSHNKNKRKHSNSRSRYGK